MKTVVTISGLAGCGKSYLSKLLAPELGLRYFGAGSVFRDFSSESGIQVAEYAASAPPDVDKVVNQAILEAERQGGVVIDSRLGGYICPASAKIWLKCSYEEAARRVVFRNSLVGKTVDYEDALDGIRTRNQNTIDRLNARYGFDLRDLRIYDLVLDNEHLEPEQTLQMVAYFITNFT